MGNRYRPNPLLEDQLKTEAELLMAEENNDQWHPPMTAEPAPGWHPPQVMPNTPRDPAVEAKKKLAMQALLKSRKSAPPIHPSQNPFAGRVPSEAEMAMTSAAVRHAQTPARASALNPQFKGYPDDFAPSQAEMDRHNPFAPTIDRAGKELDVDRPSDLPGSEDNPKMPAPEDLNSKAGNSALRQALMNKINGDDPDTKLPPMYSDGYIDAVKSNSNTNRNIALMSLLAKSANQMGSVGGKMADANGMDQFTEQAIAGNNAGMGNITALEQLRMKQKQQSSSAEKNKLILELMKLDQNADNNTTRNNLLKSDLDDKAQNRSTMADIAKSTLDLRRNPVATPLNPVQADAIRADIKLKEANAKKALKEMNAPPKAAERDPVDVKMEGKIADDTAQAMKAISAYKGWLAGFDNAPTEAEKINYAKFNLKDLQSVEFGADAINASDEPRLSGYLNQFRPMDTFRDGGQVFSPQLDKFRQEIERKLLKAQSRIKNNQQDLQGIRAQGGMNYKPNANGAPKSSLPAGKVRVFDPARGKNVLIDKSDLEEALKEPGVRVVP